MVQKIHFLVQILPLTIVQTDSGQTAGFPSASFHRRLSPATAATAATAGVVLWQGKLGVFWKVLTLFV